MIDAIVPTEGDDLWNLNCTAETITLLTSRRLVEVTGSKQTTVTLSEELGPGLVASAYVSAEQVYVGMNAGEWGGGLRRIDRRTGKVTVVERNATGGLCEGPLNTACDPVNGIAPEPWRPQCQAAAIGLVHFSPHGRIVEICGDKVTRIYFKSFGKTPQTRRGRKSDEPFETVAFFGLVSSGDALWATGIDGIYRVSRDGEATVTPLPKFRTVGGISVSFDLPQFVLVVTRINQRLSISGGVPMLVPR